MAAMDVIRPDGQKFRLVERLTLAETFLSRLTGWLFRKHVQPDEGLLITPCNAIHTLGMQFPIDVVWLDEKGQVLKYRQNCRRGRLYIGMRRSVQVLELARGKLATLHPPLEVGDYLVVQMEVADDEMALVGTTETATRTSGR